MRGQDINGRSDIIKREKFLESVERLSLSETGLCCMQLVINDNNIRVHFKNKIIVERL
jgi:hypothetical protein